MKVNTFIITPILATHIDRCLETIYRYCEPDSFYVYLIDQTKHGLDGEVLRQKYKNLLYIRTPLSTVHYTGNLGFSGANNLGISLVRTPYFTLLNDDVEIISGQWWQSVMDTFAESEKHDPARLPMAVGSSSIRVLGASLGLDTDIDLLPYKKEYSQDEYDFLRYRPHEVTKTFTILPDTYGDGIMFFSPVFKTDLFRKHISNLPEQFYPGGGEDYWVSCLAYTKGFRIIGSSKAWVWHHFSSTFRAMAADVEDVQSLQIPELNWNNNLLDWTGRFTVIGCKCDCGKTLEYTGNGRAICPIHTSIEVTVPESKLHEL